MPAESIPVVSPMMPPPMLPQQFPEPIAPSYAMAPAPPSFGPYAGSYGMAPQQSGFQLPFGLTPLGLGAIALGGLLAFKVLKK